MESGERDTPGHKGKGIEVLRRGGRGLNIIKFGVTSFMDSPLPEILRDLNTPVFRDRNHLNAGQIKIRCPLLGTRIPSELNIFNTSKTAQPSLGY